MSELATLPGAIQALIPVGAVLAEAIVLHVGYGYLEHRFGPDLLARIEST